MKLTVITKIPSPYQVELFDRVSRREDLRVIYLRRRDSDRQWNDRTLGHSASYVEDGDHATLASAVRDADATIFGWYRDPVVMRLLRARAAGGKPWAFWGERPGFNHPGLAGRTFRRLRLWRLWRDRRVPIWGIGHWAIEGYRAEFGSKRAYFHVPYTSNLSPFAAIAASGGKGGARTFLFSGSLIERKGVVELCAAFEAFARQHPGVKLRLLGGGALDSSLKDRYGANAAFEFLGFKDWDGLAAAYAGADVLCAPSRYDGWGLIVAEAMAAGIPVIGTRTTGSAREMIEEGVNGWSVATPSPEALREKLEQAYALPAESLRAMGEAGRSTAREYDVTAGEGRFIAAARKTIDGWNPARTAS